jgi:hypothetical protein
LQRIHERYAQDDRSLARGLRYPLGQRPAEAKGSVTKSKASPPQLGSRPTASGLRGPEGGSPPANAPTRGQQSTAQSAGGRDAPKHHGRTARGLGYRPAQHGRRAPGAPSPLTWQVRVLRHAARSDPTRRVAPYRRQPPRQQLPLHRSRQPAGRRDATRQAAPNRGTIDGYRISAHHRR